MKKLIHNVETNETEFVDFTDAEVKAFEKEALIEKENFAQLQAIEKEIEAEKAAARESIATKLNLTVDEIKALLG